MTVLNFTTGCDCIYQSDVLSLYSPNPTFFEDITFLETLSRWRNQNCEHFITQVPTNKAKTEAWLKTNFTQRNKNMLFIIVDGLNNSMVGHFGLSLQSPESNTYVVHSVLRGERVLTKGIMHDALLAAFNFSRDNFGAKNFSLNCLETSAAALKLYKRLEFMETGYSFLVRSSVPGGFKLIKSKEETDESIKIYKMELRRGV